MVKEPDVLTRLQELLRERSYPTDPQEARRRLPSEEWARLLATASNLPYLDPRQQKPEVAVVRVVPSVVLQRGTYLPIRRERSGEYLVVLPDPLNEDILRHIRGSLRGPVRLAVGPEDAIRQVAARILEEISTPVYQEPGASLTLTNEEEPGSIQGAQITFSRIVDMALDRGASDIHLKWAAPRTPLIQFREKGVLISLQEISPEESISAETLISVINVIKNRANLDVAQKSRPQSGSINYVTMNKEEQRDLRVEVSPSIYGEVVVIRILPAVQSIPRLDRLGFSAEIEAKLRGLVEVPHGIFLVTGPTGSGKSTTMAAIITEMASKTTKNILTVEDPVEYRFQSGIVQVQTNDRLEIPLTFATVLRSFLRMDPDVILIGEIRDRETARIAIEAAMTGHLVMGTLHTNDAPSAIPRLEDMGVERYKVSEVVRGVLAQRLVPQLCDNCAGEDAEARTILQKEYRLASHNINPRRRGPGCSLCRGTGYSGRIAIQELFWINKEVRRLLFEHRQMEEVITTARRESGYRTLREDGVDKVAKGLVDLRNMIEATYED